MMLCGTTAGSRAIAVGATASFSRVRRIVGVVVGSASAGPRGHLAPFTCATLAAAKLKTQNHPALRSAGYIAASPPTMAPPAETTSATSSTDPLAPPRLLHVLGKNNTFTTTLRADPLTPVDSLPPRRKSEADPLAAAGSTPGAPPRTASTQRELRISRQVHAFFTFLDPEPLPDPMWLGVSKPAADLLGIAVDGDKTLLGLFSGNKIPESLRPWAHNYAGHQFGFYAGQLGDGRALSLGEVEVSPPPPRPTTASTKPDPAAAPPKRWEVQLKGSGRTPYSRFGDGAAVLRSSLREFLASEYMHALGVPTSRALALLGSNKAVYREDGMEPSGVTVRLAPSWVRFGSFELCWYRGERDGVRELADYVIATHFGWIDDEAEEEKKLMVKPAPPATGPPVPGPGEKMVMEALGRISTAGNSTVNSARTSAAAKPSTTSDLRPAPPAGEPPKSAAGGRRISVTSRPNLRVAEERTATGELQAYVVAPFAEGKLVEVTLNRYARFYQEVVRRTAVMVAHWQAVGFCHGVMNTDNMSVLGITIDYGPFAFLDSYNPTLASNKSDELGRYRFSNQPNMALWNLSKFGRSMVHLIYEEGDSDDVPEDSRIDGFDVIKQILEIYEPVFIEKYTELMRKKLGFRMVKDNDLEHLISPLLQLLADVEADYTVFFRKLCDFKINDLDFRREIGPFVDSPVGPPITSIEDPKDPKTRRISQAAGPNSGGRASISAPPPNPISGCLDFLLESLNALAAEVAAEANETAVAGLERERKRTAVKVEATVKEEDEDETGDRTAKKEGEDEAEEDEDEDDGMELFAVQLPSEREIRFRWQKWAKSYRSRLLLEHAASKSHDSMETEDQNRSQRMKRTNPRFMLRNWILQDIVEALESLPELAPRDPEIERMEREFEEYGRVATGERRLKRDKPVAAGEEAEEEKREAPRVEPVPVSNELVERALRILVGDVWGEVMDADGWQGLDKVYATKWSGPVPKWGKNICLSCSS
ncbi:hypothetical protein HDU96_004846 [Phlyctochytrium bullatum]|nr:hypothetical protein HDU96_004846 [Phlyctochytrium bullatum]